MRYKNMLTIAQRAEIDEAMAEIENIIRRHEEYVRECQMEDDWNGQDIYCDERELNSWFSVISCVYAEAEADEEAVRGE
jgi:hypothetical protein